MDNPVLVEVLRGGVVESRHRGAVEVDDEQGNLVVRHRIACAGNAVRSQQTIERLSASRHEFLASRGIGMEEKAGTLTAARSSRHWISLPQVHSRQHPYLCVGAHG